MIWSNQMLWPGNAKVQKLVVLSMLFACITAGESVGKTGNGYRSFVDVSSIKLDGNIRRFWAKGVPSPKTVPAPGGNTNKWLSYFLNFEAINCEENTYLVEAKVANFDDGTTLSVPTDSSSTWQPAPPESLGESEMKLVCAWKPT
jgi:hypothetical protein